MSLQCHSGTLAGSCVRCCSIALPKAAEVSFDGFFNSDLGSHLLLVERAHILAAPSASNEVQVSVRTDSGTNVHILTTNGSFLSTNSELKSQLDQIVWSYYTPKIRCNTAVTSLITSALLGRGYLALLCPNTAITETGGDALSNYFRLLNLILTRLHESIVEVIDGLSRESEGNSRYWSEASASVAILYGGLLNAQTTLANSVIYKFQDGGKLQTILEDRMKSTIAHLLLCVHGIRCQSDWASVLDGSPDELQSNKLMSSISLQTLQHVPSGIGTMSPSLVPLMFASTSDVKIASLSLSPLTYASTIDATPSSFSTPSHAYTAEFATGCNFDGSKSEENPSAFHGNPAIAGSVLLPFSYYDSESNFESDSYHLRTETAPTTVSDPLTKQHFNEYLEDTSIRGAYQLLDLHDSEEGRDLEQENEDAMSCTTDQRSINLPPLTLELLIARFARGLCKQMREAIKAPEQAIKCLITKLPKLLRDFSIRLEAARKTDNHLRAITFVRHKRRQITCHFQHICEDLRKETGASWPKSVNTDQPLSLEDKISNWTLGEAEDPPREEDIDYDEANEDEEVDFPFAEAEAFLTESNEYQHLLAAIRATLLLTPKDGSICEDINLKIIKCLQTSNISRYPLYGRCRSEATIEGRPATTPSPPDTLSLNATFEIMWSPVEFLRSQDYEKGLSQPLGEVITITGSTIDAQATTCADFLKQNWPVTGLETLMAIENALKRQDSLFYEGLLSDGTQLHVHIKSTKVMVNASGTELSLAVLGEQLAWLGAACRQSSDENIQIVVPALTVGGPALATEGGPCHHFVIKFDMKCCKLEDNKQDRNGTCWQSLFRNPVIVEGFPILARNPSQIGLEIPLTMLADLGEAQYVTDYDGVLVIKGFLTMFVVTGQTENSVQWHFIFQKDGVRLPYQAASEVDCPRSEFGLNGISASSLETARNFVGWISSAVLRTGAKDVQYGNIDHSGLDFASSGMVIDGATLSGGHFISLNFRFAKGNKDKPTFLGRAGLQGYDATIYYASRNIHVILHDTEDRRAWLVDGASALLHLALTKLANEPFCSSPFFRHEKFTYSDPLGQAGNAARAALTNPQNKAMIIQEDVTSISEETTQSSTPNSEPKIDEKTTRTRWCFKDLVEQTWYQLEKLHDHQNRILSAGQNIWLTDRGKLEGYSYMDVVEYTDPLRPRVISLKPSGRGWIDFARSIHAITLFGKGFGNLIEPAPGSNGLCDRWKKVPTGSDYLVACTSTLQEICKKQGNIVGNRVQLAQGIYWHKVHALFEPCSCLNSGPCERGQVLYGRSLFGRVVAKKQSDLFSEPKGAVIFGRNGRFNITWPDEGEPSLDAGSEEHTKDLDDTTEHSIESSDSSSGGTSSSPVNADEFLGSESQSGTSATSVTSTQPIGASSATYMEDQGLSQGFEQIPPLQKNSPDFNRRERKSTQSFPHRAKKFATLSRKQD